MLERRTSVRRICLVHDCLYRNVHWVWIKVVETQTNYMSIHPPDLHKRTFRLVTLPHRVLHRQPMVALDASHVELFSTTWSLSWEIFRARTRGKQTDKRRRERMSHNSWRRHKAKEVVAPSGRPLNESLRVKQNKTLKRVEAQGERARFCKTQKTRGAF